MKLKALMAGIVMAAVTPLAIADDSGFYVSASVGRMTATLPEPSNLGANPHDSDSTYTIGGGYKINKYFGAEAGYQNLGTMSSSWAIAGTATILRHDIVGTGALTYKAEVDGFYLGPTFSYPINDRFSVDARLGYYRWEAKQHVSFTAAGTLDGTAVVAGGSSIANTIKTDNYLGFGATYNLAKNVDISLGYTECKIDSFRIKNYIVGVKHSF
ncbi:MAG: outer membrane beta-barrel protein [Gallionella sp.]|nr:outer membrane beta-barrel protein [Gallionella sp.]